HLHEMACPKRATVQVAFLCRAVYRLASRSALSVPPARRKRFEYGIELLDSCFFSTNHQTVASLYSPDAAARAHVHVMTTFRSQRLCSPDVIFVVRVATINESITAFHPPCQLKNSLFCGFAGRHHHPGRARFGKAAYQL